VVVRVVRRPVLTTTHGHVRITSMLLGTAMRTRSYETKTKKAQNKRARVQNKSILAHIKGTHAHMRK